MAALILAISAASVVSATLPDAADGSIRQFLTQDDTQHPYRAARRLEAENGSRTAWLEAVTEFSALSGFHYTVTAEGGSTYISTKILRAVLDGEREVIAQGEAARSSLARSNYDFQPNGVDVEGLANVLLSPKRKERSLVAGTMFLNPLDGTLVRLQGRLAKSPSFWVKTVHIVRLYAQIDGVVVPVALESQAQLRLLGNASLRMTYEYSEIDGHSIGSTRSQ